MWYLKFGKFILPSQEKKTLFFTQYLEVFQCVILDLKFCYGKKHAALFLSPEYQYGSPSRKTTCPSRINTGGGGGSNSGENLLAL